MWACVGSREEDVEEEDEGMSMKRMMGEEEEDADLRGIREGGRLSQWLSFLTSSFLHPRIIFRDCLCSRKSFFPWVCVPVLHASTHNATIYLHSNNLAAPSRCIRGKGVHMFAGG